MTSDSGFEPWPGAAYDGEAKPAPFAPQVIRHRPTRGVVVASGIAIALALGLGVGYLAQPDLAGPDTAARPMAPAPPGAQQGLIIQPGAPQAMAEATPHPTGKLEVLPPDMARAARQTAQASAPSAATVAARDVSDIAADPPSQPPVHLTPPPMTQAAPPAAYPSSPYPAAPYAARPYAAPAYPRMASVDGPCGGGLSRAAQMVCSDPDLSAADRELNRAYRRALRAGAIPPEQLRADQRDWLAAREDAARRSPRAVARLYDQRIDDLNSLADDEPD